jgi:pyrroline-5-carboxylate reductase
LIENFSVGFIGGGALAESVIKGISKKLFEPENIFVAEKIPARRDYLIAKYSVNTAADFATFAEKINLLIIAVKPKDLNSALAEVQQKITASTLVMSVVAGCKLEKLENALPNQAIIRVMPNVAVLVGEGMMAYTAGKNATAENLALAKKFWSAIGRAVEVEEKLMDAVTGLSGSGPAYAFLMIDALADGGVAAGLPRNYAIELAAQTLLGAAKMVLETGEHPDVLRDRVTSPAGTTIEGIRILERNNFRSALIEAVISASEKSKNLG